MPTVKQLYRNFIRDTDAPFCWACGRECPYHRPLGWSGPFMLERAHIVSSPRVEDIRLCVLLCTCCHKTRHGERLILNGLPWPLPKLSVANLLWLKLRYHPEAYDREFLQRYSVKRLPRAVAPPQIYLDEFKRRRAA